MSSLSNNQNLDDKNDPEPCFSNLLRHTFCQTSNSTAWWSGVRNAGRVSRRLQLQPCRANRQEIPRQSCRGCCSATRAWSAPSIVSGLLSQAAAILGVHRRQNPENNIDTSSVSLTLTEVHSSGNSSGSNKRRKYNYITVFVGAYQMYNASKRLDKQQKHTNKTGPRELYTLHADIQKTKHLSIICAEGRIRFSPMARPALAIVIRTLLLLCRAMEPGLKARARSKNVTTTLQA